MPARQQDMANKLIDGIQSYLHYLSGTYGYKITLHGIETVAYGSWPQLLVYNYHECAVCREIKTSAAAWDRCVSRQGKVGTKADAGPYMGTCYAGVTEAVFPLKDVHDKRVGFLCVSGYTADRQQAKLRAEAAASRYGLSQEKMIAAVSQLDDRLPDLTQLTAQLVPVQTMLSMLFYFLDVGGQEKAYGSSREKLYYDILRYVNTGFRNPEFGMKDVCSHFYISYSYGSRLFAEFHRVSFARYMRQIRIEAAKRYLEHTALPIGITASECGFSDSNYFSSVFKSETGLTPSEYRRRYGQESH